MDYGDKLYLRNISFSKVPAVIRDRRILISKLQLLLALFSCYNYISDSYATAAADFIPILQLQLLLALFSCYNYISDSYTTAAANLISILQLLNRSPW